MWHRLLRLIIKELQTILGSSSGLRLLLMPVFLQTAIFPFAATLEVKNATIAIYNQDGGSASIELIQRLAQMAAFEKILFLHGEAEVQQSIDAQTALLVLQVPPDFSRKLMNKQEAPLQMLLDGRRSNSGQIASGYVLQVLQSYAQERGVHASVNLQARNLYNPNLEFRWHVLPCLVAVIATVGCLIVTALSVAREREEGTFDQLLVSPLSPAYIMAGKAVPGICVAGVQASFIAIIAHWVYGVPFTGSLPVLVLGVLAYGLALAGIGLFISSMCATQQQAFLGVFAFMVPAVILSGYVAPVENMPQVLQWIAQINPMTYVILLLKGVFLRGLSFSGAWQYLQALLLIALCTLSAALYLFRRHIA